MDSTACTFLTSLKIILVVSAVFQDSVVFGQLSVDRSVAPPVQLLPPSTRPFRVTRFTPGIWWKRTPFPGRPKTSHLRNLSRDDYNLYSTWFNGKWRMAECQDVVDNKYTTNRSNGVWALVCLLFRTFEVSITEYSDEHACLTVSFIP